MVTKTFVPPLLTAILAFAPIAVLAGDNSAHRHQHVVDLSHVQEQSMPADPALKTPENKFFAHVGEGEGAYWNLENITYTPHTGTHMDAPFHVDNKWGGVESIDPMILMGPASVVSLDIPNQNYVIKAKDIQQWEQKHGKIRKGDAVLLHTGHDANWPDKKKYIDDGYPTLSTDAAEYLVTKKIRYVGMETISPDGPNTDTHKILMGHGIMVVENLTNLGKIGTSRCYTIGTFPNIKGATGVYIRLLATN